MSVCFKTILRDQLGRILSRGENFGIEGLRLLRNSSLVIVKVGIAVALFWYEIRIGILLRKTRALFLLDNRIILVKFLVRRAQLIQGSVGRVP